MKNTTLYILMLLLLTSVFSCQRQQLEEFSHTTALIPIEVNWGNSGITPSRSIDQNMVHRISFRFFPKDGSEIFELYLEGDVYGGVLEVPIGEYSVMAMNESVLDNAYWSDYFTFSDINDFQKIAVTVVPDNPNQYDFYTPIAGERIVKATHKLASWSVEDFVVTKDLATRTRATRSAATRSEFTLDVEMRRLTYDFKVLVKVENLKSAQLMRGAMRGLSQKVYLSSAKTANESATQFFTLNGRKYNAGSNTDGTTEQTFRTFGVLPKEVDASYSMMLDIIMVDGTRYIPITPFEYELTDEIKSQTDLTIPIEIEQTIELPKVDGDISVPDWGDDEIIVIE